jgi:hypothetical protein
MGQAKQRQAEIKDLKKTPKSNTVHLVDASGKYDMNAYFQSLGDGEQADWFREILFKGLLERNTTPIQLAELDKWQARGKTAEQTDFGITIEGHDPINFQPVHFSYGQGGKAIFLKTVKEYLNSKNELKPGMSFENLIAQTVFMYRGTEAVLQLGWIKHHTGKTASCVSVIPNGTFGYMDLGE